MKIVQFIPYYPPHIGGLETHAQERSLRWKKKGYGTVVNVVSSLGQQFQDKQLIKYKGETIGYLSDGIEILVLESFDIIAGFFVPKFWKRSFWCTLKYLKTFGPDVLITRTRFFLTTFLGGVFAKIYRKKWVHIEHGSGFLKLNTWRKNLVGRIYDHTLGRWAFAYSDLLIPISNTCAKFIYNNFTKRQVNVIYRGMDFVNKKICDECENLHERFSGKIIVGFVGRLFRWKNAGNLIKAYYSLDNSLREKIQLVIVGDGEDFISLKNLDQNNLVYFMGQQSFEKTICLQKQFDVNFHTSAPGGGLASTLLQALWLGPLIVATPYEGANEVIKDLYNGVLLNDSSVEEMKRGLQMIIGDCRGSIQKITEERLHKIESENCRGFMKYKRIEDGKLKIEKGKNGKLKIDDDKSIGNGLLQARDKFAEINKDIVRQQFDWDKNIENYFDLFDKMVGGKS